MCEGAQCMIFDKYILECDKIRLVRASLRVYLKGHESPEQESKSLWNGYRCWNLRTCGSWLTNACVIGQLLMTSRARSVLQGWRCLDSAGHLAGDFSCGTRFGLCDYVSGVLISLPPPSVCQLRDTCMGQSRIVS